MDVWGRDESSPVAHWSLDRTVSITAVVGLIGYFATMIWWAANLSVTVAAINQQMQPLATLPERMARLEERVSAMQRDVAEIKAATNKRALP